MNRIQNFFAGKTGTGQLNPVYLVAAYPDQAAALRTAEEAVADGANIFFIGAPFSEPMADAPKVAAHAQQAAAEGKGIQDALEMGAALRERHPEIILVLNSYTNLILKYGAEKLCGEMAEAGFDALDVTDLPYEEHGEMKPACRAGNICLISTIHPAADCRRAQTIAQDAQGFIKTLSPADDSITTLPVITAGSIKYLG